MRAITTVHSLKAYSLKYLLVVLCGGSMLGGWNGVCLISCRRGFKEGLKCCGVEMG